jgi:hypothetical protein
LSFKTRVVFATKITRVDEGDECNFPKAKYTHVLNDKFCWKKLDHELTNCIRLDYFIHHRFRPTVRLYFLDYSDSDFDINFFAAKLYPLFFHCEKTLLGVFSIENIQLSYFHRGAYQTKKKKELIKYVVPIVSYGRECIQKL